MHRGSHLIWIAAGLSLATIPACGEDNEPDPPPSAELVRTTNPLIEDAAHGGVEGAWWLPPLVARPDFDGDFEPRLASAVQIRVLELSSGLEIRRFGPCAGGYASPCVALEGGDDPHYRVNWNTRADELDDELTYRILAEVRGRVGGEQVAFADVDVVDSGRGLKKVDSDQFVALRDGRTLPIKLRLEVGLADHDGDGVLDFDDNCPAVANAGQLDTVVDPDPAS